MYMYMYLLYMRIMVGFLVAMVALAMLQWMALHGTSHSVYMYAS